MPEWPALPARLRLLACRGLQKPERILQTPLNMLCTSRDHSEETTSDEEDEAEDEAEDEKKEEDKEKMTTKKLVTKAVLMLLAGTIVCAVFSDPMVDAVSNFSKVSSWLSAGQKIKALGCSLHCEGKAGFGWNAGLILCPILKSELNLAFSAIAVDSLLRVWTRRRLTSPW